jgi:exopolysaccharide biosynthesis polyprenyl glycosylphosphotransferase
MWGVVSDHLLLVFLYVVLWVGLALYKNLYSSKRTVTLPREVLDVCWVTTVAVAVAVVIPRALIFRGGEINREFIAIFWTLSLCSQVLLRVVVRTTLRLLRRHGRNIRRVLIVGSNRRSLRLLQKMGSSPDFGLQAVGYIDDPSGIHPDTLGGVLPALGGLDDLERLLESEAIDEVFVTLPIKSYYGKVAKMVGICEEVGVEVKVLSDLFALKLARDSIYMLDDISLLHFTTVQVDEFSMWVKRSFDWIVSGLGLLLLAPLFLIVSALIRMSSRGPVFFRQERVGWHQRRFTLLKFRSMCDNADEMKAQLLHLSEVEGPVFKMKNDPRVTRIGRFLRKYSIDELPQLVNVFRGDMSLVGPRPPIPSEVERYNWWQKRRLSVRPGITCLWQVGGRSQKPFDWWISQDLKYIDNWSLLLDLKILARTIPAVFRGRGAY